MSLMRVRAEARDRSVGPMMERIERDWFRAYYKEHASFVRRLVLRLGGSHSESEDVVQDVFVVVHRKWPQLQPGSVDARTWLCGVVVRVVRREQRRQKLRAFFHLDGSREPKEEQTPATLLERREVRTTVQRLLDSLPEKKRIVLVLFEIEGLSGRQIARILGVPVQTVWNRLFDARKAFLKALARERLREQHETEVHGHG